MATTRTATSKSKKAAAPTYVGPTQEQRLEAHLDVMVNYVRNLMPKAEKAIDELVAALQSGSVDRALAHFTGPAVHGQVIRDNFAVLNSRLVGKEEGLDIVAELTAIRDMMMKGLIGGVFMPNSSNNVNNLLSVEKGRVYGIQIQEIDSMLKGYNYLKAMNPEQYAQNHL